VLSTTQFEIFDSNNTIIQSLNNEEDINKSAIVINKGQLDWLKNRIDELMQKTKEKIDVNKRAEARNQLNTEKQKAEE